MLLGPECPCGPIWLEVRAAGYRSEGKHCTWLIGEVNSVQTPWQREHIPTYVLLYMSSQACCCVTLLPGSTCVLL